MGVDRSAHVSVGFKIKHKLYKNLEDGVWSLVAPFIRKHPNMLEYGSAGDEWSGTDRCGWIGLKRLTVKIDDDSAGFHVLKDFVLTPEEFEVMNEIQSELDLGPLQAFIAGHVY